jgi:molybdenum cofactor guanylyltransferase
VRAGAERLVHPLARRCFLRAEKAHALHLELSANQRRKRESFHDDIAPKNARPFVCDAELCAHRFVGLPCKKCHLPFVVGLEIEEPVALQTAPRNAADFADFHIGMCACVASVVAEIVVPGADENMPDACAHAWKLAWKSRRAQTESMLFSAALIAGGKSTRMGRDKAALMVGGCPLWRRQLDTLAATRPAELFVAGKCAPVEAVEVIEDRWPDCGPLGGIATALQRAKTPWLLVLAVDMPAMTPAFLSELVARAEKTGRGSVPKIDGQWEPLAALYPKAALPIAEAMIAVGRFALRDFIEAAREVGLVESLEVTDTALFVNVNEPEDFRSLRDVRWGAGQD